MTAARQGDREAMSRLVNELTPLVWHVARSNGLDRNDAEDVVQSVWLALFSQLDRLQDTKALAAWLITSTRRAAQHPAGRRKQPVPLTDAIADSLASPSPAPEDEVLRAERQATVWRAFNQLSSRSRELLRLLVVDNEPHETVARKMSVARGSIGPMRTRALRQLRELIATEYG